MTGKVAVADAFSASSCLAEVTETPSPETAVSGPSCHLAQSEASPAPQPEDLSSRSFGNLDPESAQVREETSQDPSRNSVVSPTALSESNCPGNRPVLGLSPQSVTEGVGQATARTQSGSLFLELFAGTARMCKAFSRVGFQVLAVDSVKPQAAPALALDLTKAANQKLTLDLVRSKRLAAVHLAPPCEAAYPQTLCRHWASLVLGALEDVGLVLKRENQPGTASFAAAERHAPVCVDPFQGQQWVRPDLPRLPTGPSLSLELGSTTPSSPRVPRPSRSPCAKVRGGPLWDSQSSQKPSCSGPTVARTLPAPCHLPPALEKTVSSLSSQLLSEVHKLRCQRLKAMCDMAQELQPQEDQEQAGLEPHLKGILKGKRLRLFETLLRGIDYPDKGLVQDMKRGFRLTKFGRTGLRTTRLSGASVALVAMMNWISSCGNRL